MDQWNEHGDGGGGGYFNENGFGTPSTQAKAKPAARQQFLCPVTIRQLLEAPEDGLKVGPLTATMVTLVGVVINVEVSSTNVKFTLADDTGVIDCMDWLESEDSGELKKTIKLVENTYYQVFGCIKSPQGHRRIMVFKVVPIEDFNDYCAFMAEVLSVNQYAEKANEAPASAMEVTYNNPGISKSSGIDDHRTAFTPVQRAVFEAIKMVESQIGWNKNDQTLRSKFTPKLIDEALDFLIGEGHIYSTVDDDHYSST